MVAVTEESNVMDETIKTTKKSKKSKKRTQEEDDVAIPAKKQKVDKGSDSDTSKKSKKNKKEKSLDTSVVDESEKKKKKRKSAADTSVVTEEETETPKKEKKKKKQKVEENGTANGTEHGNGDASLNEETETPKQEKTKKMKQKAEENGVENGKGDASDNDCGLTPEEREGALTNFNISQPTLEKLQERGVKYLFPIQSKTFNHVYGGHDVIAQARTGTGKTLAFSIPLVERLQEKGGHMQRGRAPRVIVMAPTRELAKQVGDDFSSISSQLSVLCVYGGTPYFPQEKQLNSGVDVLVGTPGRIGDLVEKGVLNLSKLEHVVLDEVDRMLDMGFADKVEEILANAYNKEDSINPQTLLFTATLPAWVYQTAKKYMKENVHRVDLIGQQTTRTATTVQHFAIKCSYFERAATIGQVLSVYSGNHGRAMVFCQTKKDADELAVSDSIKQETHVMHGDIPQDKREMVLKGFREGRYKCLITTDVAARGLDIPEVDLVIQCSIPQDIDSYIHRSGRTGRAGRTGTCVLFYKPREDGDVQWVENKAGIKFKRIGAPTAEDMIKSAAEDAVRSINSVPKATLDQFRESAKTLLEEKDPEEAIAAALACISGNTGEIKARSLLNSSEGYTTYFFRTNIEMRSLSYAWRALENKLGAEYKEKIKGMTFTKDKMGCVFDFPSDLESYMDDHWVDGKFDSLEKATELPELAVSEGFSSPGGRGGFRGRGGGFGGRGGFRGRGGSRGGSGGFRGRGGSRGGFSRGRGSGMTIGGPQQNTKKTFD